MVRSSFTTAAIITALFAVSAEATQLSHNLSSHDVRKTEEILGLGSVHRYWTAHGLPTVGLGVEFGLETTFLCRRDMLELGDHTAVMPRVIPVPRLWFSWDLPRDFIVSGSFAPGLLFDGVTAASLGVQWKFFEETDISTNLSWAASYTGVEAFGDMSAHNFATSAQVSRDLVFWQPYAGAGIIMNTSAVDADVVAVGVGRRHFLPATHFYAGARIDLVAKIALQVEMINRYFGFSAMLATQF